MNESERSKAIVLLGGVIQMLAREDIPPPSALELQSLASWLARALDVRQPSLPLIAAPPPKSKAADATKEREAGITLRVFAYWIETSGHTKAKLTPERERAIRARVREGYSEETLRRAVLGCSMSPWHNGDKTGDRYDDLELIMRTGAKVEQFAAKVIEGVSTSSVTSIARDNEEEIKRLREVMRDASLRRDKPSYDAANEALALLKKARTG